MVWEVRVRRARGMWHGEPIANLTGQEATEILRL